MGHDKNMNVLMGFLVSGKQVVHDGREQIGLPCASGHLQHDRVILIPSIKYFAFGLYLMLSEITVMLVKPGIYHIR